MLAVNNVAVFGSTQLFNPLVLTLTDSLSFLSSLPIS
jgi:hypothetical protein